MLDLDCLDRIRLSARPAGQMVMGGLMLAPNYNLPPQVTIEFDGFDRVPDTPVIYAMNHTDRYNYWPFQYRLWRTHDRFTATWVKGKYYENKWVGKFMELMNNIPTVSRGYVIARDFKSLCQRPPTGQEYRALRSAVDRAADTSGDGDDVAVRDTLVDTVPAPILRQPRNVLGRRFAADREPYTTYINEVFAAMMRRFVDLNWEAFDKGLDLLVFPQGTRSIRLSKGRIGLSQIALSLQKPVVPIGCNGSDDVYPGNSPVGRPGHIIYRAGEPVYYEDVDQFHIDTPFEPFTAAAEDRHRDKFQGYVDLVMDRINAQLDPKYRFADDLASDGVAGSRRFL